MAEIIDISIPVFTGMVFYPGDPGATVQTVRSIDRGDVANLSELRLGSHCGTHVDAPHHFENDGRTVDRIPLDALVGEARVLDLTGIEGSITRADLEAAGINDATRVLLKTDNSKLWGESVFSPGYVSLSDGAAAQLVEAGVVLVGIDYLSIERFQPETFNVHHTLLGAGVVVLEGIDLAVVEPGGYELVCLPLKVAGGDGAPARAILIDRRG